MERILQTLDKLEGLIRGLVTQQCVIDPAKQIELPSSQSNDEAFPLDEPTSKERTTLSIDDEELEVDAGDILDNYPISKTDVLPQEKKLEANHNRQVASFLMRDVMWTQVSCMGGKAELAFLL
ncbi:hypothetical protein ACLB2K_040035 [Fragaria x ananassa]